MITEYNFEINRIYMDIFIVLGGSSHKCPSFSDMEPNSVTHLCCMLLSLSGTLCTDVMV